MTTTRWWLTPRVATELPRHGTAYWRARGVGVTDLDRLVLAAIEGVGARFAEAVYNLGVTVATAGARISEFLAGVGLVDLDQAAADAWAEHVEQLP